MTKKITILVPTDSEAARIRLAMPLADIRICGVGAVETAIAAAKAAAQRPDMIILAGIAGSYGTLRPGQSVLVARERTADMGAFRSDGFKNIFAKSYLCPYTAASEAFPAVVSNCVNAAGAPYIDLGAEIENMEGAGFFAACIDAVQPFLELRTISNMVTDSRERWQTELALKNLARDLKTLIDEINA